MRSVLKAAIQLQSGGIGKDQSQPKKVLTFPKISYNQTKTLRAITLIISMMMFT